VPADPAVSGATPPWLEAVLSAFFWLVILSVIIYALVRFARERLALDLGTGDGSIWSQLRDWLHALWRAFIRWRQTQRERRLERQASKSTQSRVPLAIARLLSLRSLSPRQLVRYFYLSVERRAAQAGQPRRPGQTPYEYQDALDTRFPDLEPDLTGLTEAFVRARYSPQSIDREDADAAKPLWQRIKAALRRRRVGQ
jgi:hypothetical protein